MKNIYVKRDIKGYYVEFPNQLNPDEYNNLGTTYEDFVNNKWVLLSEDQIGFKETNPNASVKEVLNMELNVYTQTENVRDLLDAKKEAIYNIYTNDDIKSFNINNITTWFDAEKRNNLRNLIDSAKLLEQETISFYVDDSLLTIKVTDAEIMLAKIQLYINDCDIINKQHELNIDKLTTIEEVDSYDYKAGYPEKLHFVIG